MSEIQVHTLAVLAFALWASTSVYGAVFALITPNLPRHKARMCGYATFSLLLFFVLLMRLS